MERDGKALAADELETNHRHAPGVASVHVRAIVTWCAIFPLVAIGMTVMGLFANGWPPVLRALVLTAVVVPVTVYFIVPRLLLAHSRITAGRARNRSAVLSGRESV
ncbi:hypothetical protein [Subtercola frigoramans]|uniref:Antibiotic biosynthesis monooxygenase (ABM) superfamily enzyme n=1 Tax=Subtercola frigoramans TaxID=120298 RepID=A0ABS2L149_9MICO|nr:hypothetical protein [Subtercola frigoramans]MBM7470800.1 antibiotic biosynthesis monooxygenase (ABM) superfamily enzyme [Subtercola frigoramans]